MSSQSGRGGIGSRKHGVSGKVGHNADVQWMLRDINREKDARAAAKQRHKSKMFSSIKELMRS